MWRRYCPIPDCGIRLALASQSSIQHLSPDVVEPYQANQLSWVAVATNGTVIPWNRLSRTKIFVLKGKAKHYRDDTRLSDYSDYKQMSNVTQGKEVGASHDEY